MISDLPLRRLNVKVFTISIDSAPGKGNPKNLFADILRIVADNPGYYSAGSAHLPGRLYECYPQSKCRFLFFRRIRQLPAFCYALFSAFKGFRSRGRHGESRLLRVILPLSTVRNPVSQIRTVGYCLSLRVKMTEFYFLPYKTTKIYGKGTEIRCFGRSERPISTGQNAILLISSVEACRRSDSGSLAGRRTGIRPVIPDRLRR